MGVVTGIVPSPRKEGRFELLVDGKEFGVVSLELVERLGLRIGLTVDESPGAPLVEGVAVLAAYDRALNMLAAQSRSARDLRRRLVQKGLDPAHVDLAIERLRATGFLDDDAFARQFARSRVLGAGHSRRRVQQELYKRGVERDAIDEAVDEVFEDEAVDETELVEQAARKKLRTLGRLDAATRRRRLYGFLARRGYESDAIRAVMARVLASGEVDALDDLEGGEEDPGAGADDQD